MIIYLCTPMDPHIWLSKSRTTSKNLHWAAMWGYGMSICLSLSLSLSFSIYQSISIYIYIYEGPTISFQKFFVWELLLIVHTWNSSPLPSNILWLQSTCCTVPTSSGRPHGSSLVWACQWPSSQPISSPQLSHNDSLWA